MRFKLLVVFVDDHATEAVTQAARDCGLERQALQQIMRRYGLTADPFREK